MKNEKHKFYDVCIIGAGPAGLACLSTIQEPYSLDLLTDNQILRASAWIQRNPQSKSKKVCVIDPNHNWFHQWDDNFQTLDISFLRSPTIAHCSYFDKNALLAYAISNGREDELLESGCSSIKSLRGTVMPQVGLWKLPSSKLFLDFSRNLASTLPHDYIQGKAIDIKPVYDDDLSTASIDSSSKIYRIILENQVDVYTSSVIVAAGMAGKPIIPESLLHSTNPIQTSTSKQRIYQWKELNSVLSTFDKMTNGVLVVGGGLTAIQAAQKIVRHVEREGVVSSKVVLCSRRPVVERHFDIPVKWFDEREARLLQADFYHEPEGLRLDKMKSVRGGGSIPPIYMDLNREMEQRGRLQTMVGEVYIKDTDEDGSLIVSISSKTTMKFDAIVLACGIKPDCLSNPFIQKIHSQWPIKVKDGYPCLSEDLQWTDGIYVVGGLASLSVGPDGGNLMGISRAAETVAIAIDSKSWLRHQQSSVLKNPFDVFLEESDLSSSEDD